jgi:hypothetical protein
VRNFGGILIVAGIVGFLYCSNELGKAEAVPEGLSVSQSFRYPAGKLEVGRYGALAVAGMGVLLALFPSGR